MTFEPQLIDPFVELIWRGVGTATLILIVVLVRRQRQIKKVLDDLDRRSRVLSRLESELRELKTSQTTAPMKADSSLPQSTTELPPGSSLEKKHRVISLAQRGLDPEDIARQLNIYRGEAELVLSLSRYFKQGSQETQDATVQ
ncbi:MAG TPA: hypothetical protein VKZ59_02020 [Acidobacteriota bacterium]|nr:hypothetical protein [Acidobacteriota bacterium]